MHRVIAIAGALALLGCASTPLPAGEIVGDGMPDRLYCLVGSATGCTIFRSAQLSHDQMVAMQTRFGLRSVLKLNYAWESRDDVPPGVELIDDPLSSELQPSPAEIDKICQDLDIAPKPVDIHCEAGRERTGFIAERCVRNRAMPIASSATAQCGEWLAFGMRPLLAIGLREAFHRDTGQECPPQ